MPCDDKKMSELLIKYFDGMLSEDSNKEMENHLKLCPECNSQYKTMLMLAGSTADNDEHLSPDLIAEYYQNRENLMPEVISKIESHLENCRECAYELEFLKGMEKELYDSVSFKAQKASVGQRVFEFMQKLVLKPAFAYFLLLLALYPAFRWLTSPLDIDRSPGIRSYELLESTRGVPVGDSGSIQENIVIRSTSGDFIKLTIPLYHSVANYQYNIDIIRNEPGLPDNQVNTNAPYYANYDREDSIQIIVNTSEMPDADYLLKITEIDREDPEDIMTYTYYFTLTTNGG